MSQAASSLRRVDDPDTTVASLAGREIPGCYSEYSEIMKELTVRLDAPFGHYPPVITLSRKEEHPPAQRWSAFVREFHCGWYGATPREALRTLYDQWHRQTGRVRALDRISSMDDLVESF